MQNKLVVTVECSLRVLLVHEVEPCAIAERQVIDAGSGDVFAHLPWLGANTIFAIEVRLVE